MRRALRPKPCPRCMSCSSAFSSSVSWPAFSSTCGGAPRTSRTSSPHRIPPKNPATAGFFAFGIKMAFFLYGNPMAKRWKKRPHGATWGEFGDDDQRGRMNLLTEARRLRALKEVRTGRVFCLCHPLDRPGGNVLNAARLPPVFHPVMRDGLPYFNLAFEKVDPRFSDVGSDEAVMLYTQYSTHWDGFPHKGTQFDADGDGKAEKVFYNG